jgi:hypothetical protein
MRINLMDKDQQNNGRKHHPGKVGSSFGYDPKIPEEKNRLPLLSLSSDDIHRLLSIMNAYVREIEKVSSQIKAAESSMSKLSRRADAEAKNAKTGFDIMNEQSFLMAHTYMLALTKLVHGPVSGMSIYMLKSLFYSLSLAEKSVAAGATKSEFKQTQGEPADALV